ncbi:uncharacterized protein G2W53_005983 [Senna tora]|uniref:Uncharacterized protein n=1 Tax=Senna tora TaxID=362788 RepID=A0A834X374_9FABA|nr:uncharacterized protein G2W53_005983 [Senna tora]
MVVRQGKGHRPIDSTSAHSSDVIRRLEAYGCDIRDSRSDPNKDNQYHFAGS